MRYQHDFVIEAFKPKESRYKQGPRSDKGLKHNYPARRRQRKDKGKKHSYPARRKPPNFSFIFCTFYKFLALLCTFSLSLYSTLK
jgi:hypothetical protein